jgi:hypothetical protein
MKNSRDDLYIRNGWLNGEENGASLAGVLNDEIKVPIWSGYADRLFVWRGKSQYFPFRVSNPATISRSSSVMVLWRS